MPKKQQLATYIQGDYEAIVSLAPFAVRVNYASTIYFQHKESALDCLADAMDNTGVHAKAQPVGDWFTPADVEALNEILKARDRAR